MQQFFKLITQSERDREADKQTGQTDRQRTREVPGRFTVIKGFLDIL